MKRHLLVFITVIFLGVCLFAFGWSGFNFVSYARGGAHLSLEKIAPQQVRLDETVTMSLLGEGFDDETRVSMSLDVNNQDAVVGTFPLDGVIHDMEIIGNNLFLAGNKHGLRILDISEPLKPKMISKKHLLNTSIIDIERQGDTLYLSCGMQGVKIAQIEGKAKLVNWRSLKTWSAAIASRAVGHFLYVAAAKGGLLVYDLDNIADGQPHAVIPSEYSVRGLAVFDGYLYDVSGPGGVRIFKIGDSGLPLLTGQLSFDRPLRSITIADGSLYALERGRLSQYSLVDPQSPRLVAEQAHFSMPQRLHYAGDRIYISDNASGLGVIDNSDKLLSRPAEFFNVGGDSRVQTTVGQYLYAAVSQFGIKIIDTKAILPRQVVDSVGTTNDVVEIEIKGEYLFFADQNKGIYIKNLSDRDIPQNLFCSTSFASFSISGDFLYVAGQNSGIEVYSLRDPGSPESSAKWPELKMRAISVVGNYLVGSVGRRGLNLIRLPSAGVPKILDTVPGIIVSELFVRGDLVFVAGGREGLSIYRIEDDVLSFLSQVRLPFPLDQFSNATQVRVVDGLAYVANGEGGLMIVDVTSPDVPHILSSLRLPGFVVGLMVEGNRVYAASRFSGLSTIDVSNPQLPTVLSSIAISDLAGAPQRYKELLYLENRYMGVSAIPLPRELEAVSVLSSELLQVTIPPPALPGRYSLQVSNREGTASLDGVLRYQ